MRLTSVRELDLGPIPEGTPSIIKPEPSVILLTGCTGWLGSFVLGELLTQTTCPPHVHSLNGVAERAIRSIVENARKTKVHLGGKRKGLSACVAKRSCPSCAEARRRR